MQKWYYTYEEGIFHWSKPMSQKVKKIVVVEDDALIAADISSTLEGFGYEIVGPYDAGEDLIKDASKISADLILMDINLKGQLDGIQTAEQIQTSIDAPVVFLSALSDEATLSRARLVKPYGYLIKPYDSVELKTNIELTIDRYRHKESGVSIAPEKEVDFTLGDLAEGSSPEERMDFLSKLPLFKGIEESILRDIAAQSAVTMCPAGQFLCTEGEQVDGGFVPVTGRISVTKTSESGKELIVTLLAPGDCFGLFYLLDGFNSAVSARTQIDSKVLWIPGQRWQFLIKQTPMLYKNIAEELAARLGNAYTLSSSLAHAKVEDRIIHTLCALMPGFGKSSGKSSREGRIFMTRKELSELTGTTPETAIRITKSLERDGILDLTRPGIIKIPDLQKLRSYIENK